MATAQDVLIRASELSEEFGVCTGAIAVDDDGNSVSVLSPNVQAFCSLGLIARAAIDLRTSTTPLIEEQAIILFRETNDIPEEMSVSWWNDKQVADPEEIRAAFRRAAGRPAGDTEATASLHLDDLVLAV